MSKVTVSDFLIAVSDLIEAQSNELKKEWSEFLKEERKNFANLFASFSFFFIFAFLILLGFVTFCAASYMLLSYFIPKFLAMYIISALFFIFAVIVINKAKKNNESK